MDEIRSGTIVSEVERTIQSTNNSAVTDRRYSDLSPTRDSYAHAHAVARNLERDLHEHAGAHFLVLC